MVPAASVSGWRHRVRTVAGTGWKLTSISWAVAGGLAAWAAARAAAVDRVERAESKAVPLLALTPQAAAAAPWLAVGLRLARRPKAATTAAVAGAALSLMVRPRGVARPQPSASGPVVRVLSFNMYFGRGDAEIVVARVRQTDADVLFLQELTENAVTRLKQAGLDDLLPHSLTELRGGSRGSGIYSRFPLSEGPAVPPVYMAQPTALAELPGGQAVELICVHPVAPAPGSRGGAVRWREDLRALPAAGQRPRVMAGDYNSTLDHTAFRDVLRRGYADAAQQAGKALNRTWGPPGRGWELLSIDHVLVDHGCAVLDFAVHFIPGSDHRAVYAEIQLPEPGPAAAG
jgi:endonuclease/exonuclease/phosphatase (EEP) superfamily protein YafD